MKIRNSRSRPCVQNILDFGGNQLNLLKEDLKCILCGMVERNKIYDGGKEGQESYYVTTADDNDVNKLGAEINPIEIIEFNLEASKIVEDDSSKLVNNESVKKNSNGNLESYIDEKFHETLISIIKTQVKQELNLLNENKLISTILKTSNELSSNEVVNNNSTKIIEFEKLIDSLKSEVDFLRKEVSSKDKIIELLITGGGNNISESIKRQDNRTINNRRR